MTPEDLELLYRDEWLVAIHKPSGLLVHRGWARDDVVALTLVRDLLGQWVYPVHRLDRGTSGVLVFARSRDAARALSDAFASGQVTKRYVALVRGVAPDEGVIDQPVPTRPKGRRMPASTSFRTLAVSRETEPRACSLVEARPATGRLHQVRRHLKHVGHPVIGDSNYGKGPLNRAFAERYGLGRLALHACELRFPHPVDGRAIELSCDLPDDLVAPLERMGFPAPKRGG